MVGLSNNQIKNLPDGILGISRTTNMEELAQIYSESTVLVNPTYSDNFPTTNIEALACGTPIVTYNTGGSPEAIDDKTGIVVEQGDVSSLIKAIMDISKNPLYNMIVGLVQKIFLIKTNNLKSILICIMKFLSRYKDDFKVQRCGY